jgi:hypothetical protein
MIRIDPVIYVISTLFFLISLVCALGTIGWTQDKESTPQYAVGFIDKTGKIVIPPKFDEVKPFSEGRAAVSIRDKSLFIDETGKVVIQPQFDGRGWSGHFSQGIVRVRIGGKCGFIDKAGRMLIQPQFDEAHENFSEGLAGVRIGCDKKGKWGFIDQTGKLIIQPQFSRAFGFREGLAAVSIDGKWGFIDRTGKVVIQPQFAQVKNFSDGLAPVRFGQMGLHIPKGVNKPGGEPAVVPGWEEYYRSKGGLQANNKFGFVDKMGNMAISPQFDWADTFHEGLACVQIGEKFGFIDKTGKLVIQPQFEWADHFSEGLAWVDIGKNNCGAINKTGKLVIRPQFKYSSDIIEGIPWVFSDGLSRFCIPNPDRIFQARCGYVDKNGQVVIQPQFVAADDFHEGLAAVLVKTGSQKPKVKAK